MEEQILGVSRGTPAAGIRISGAHAAPFGEEHSRSFLQAHKQRKLELGSKCRGDTVKAAEALDVPQSYSRRNT